MVVTNYPCCNGICVRTKWGSDCHDLSMGLVRRAGRWYSLWVRARIDDGRPSSHMWIRMVPESYQSFRHGPTIRKTYHKKSSAGTIRETMKVDDEEVRNNKSHVGETDSNCWVPHERTGIYYPKGQEKVVDGIPPAAGKDVDVVNWFSHHGEY
ncbi:hypothetical protein NC651_025824 [Populus alba x Populus x berolinensis]|nr:hypothetical protein NC651_025824 [Populus alba x Populus x berolinensis]